MSILTKLKTNKAHSHRKSSFRLMHALSKTNIDLPLLAGMLLCFSLSVLVLYSAKFDYILIKKQILRILIASNFMLVCAQIPPRVYRAWANIIYWLAILLLIGVLLKGQSSKGAQRWLDLGFFRFQPAELAKLAVPLMIAKSLDQHVLPPSLSLLILPVIYIILPVTLICLQPDLGTAVLVGSTGLLVLFFSGISWRIVGSVLFIGIISTPIIWQGLRDYQRQRILTLLNPEKDPLGTGYHIIQSKIAIGSGGMYGKGWLNGTQSHLEFLPERTTDFIFAVFGEEFGFIGILFLLLIYLLIIVRGLQIGAQARDTFARLLAGSFIMTFFVYVFVNIGMVNGLLPVVGIPLPLISYGGTSLVTIMISFGILMSIKGHNTLVKK